jgi:hypothetical protein
MLHAPGKAYDSSPEKPVEMPLRSHGLFVKISGRHGRVVKAISDPWLGEDILGIIRVQLDLLPQILDEYAKVVDLVAVIRPPDRLQKLAV